MSKYYEEKEMQVKHSLAGLQEIGSVRKRTDSTYELVRRGVLAGAGKDTVTFERLFLLESQQSHYLAVDNGYGLFDKAGKTLVFAKCRRAMVMLRFVLRYAKMARMWRVISRYHGKVRMSRGLRGIKGDWDRDRALARLQNLIEAKGTGRKEKALGAIREWSHLA